MSNNIFPPPAYPLDAFLTNVRNSAYEMKSNIKAPDALIGSAMIGAMTLACQCLVEVMLPVGIARPTTQFIAIVGESGERKSVVDSLAYDPFREADAMAVASHNKAMQAYEIELDWWRTLNNSIRREIDRAFRQGEPMDNVKEQLAAHAKLKPKKPKLRTLIRSDITPRAIMDALEGDGESIAIMTDDGESLFKSGAMANLGLLNRLWDSPKSLPLDRAGQEHITASNPRVSIFVMTQLEALNGYRENRGKLAKGSGHWARYLVGFPQSTKGTRWIEPDKPAWEHLPKFHERIRELLLQRKEKVDAGDTKLEVLEFSDDAKARWTEQANHNEWMIAPGGYMSDIDDFASKAMEITARLAATMHYFAGESGKISLDTLERSLAIVRWHADEYKRLFSPLSVVSQVNIDAHAIVHYLRSRWCGMHSDTFIPKNQVLRNGPLRDKAKMRLDAVLDFLGEQGAVQIVRGPDPKDRRLYIRLMNTFFVNIAI